MMRELTPSSTPRDPGGEEKSIAVGDLETT